MVQQVFEGTPLAEVEMPDGVSGFGLAEVAYLLARHETREARHVSDLIGLDALDLTDDFLRAGASSLVARGLLTRRTEADGVHVVSLAEAAVMEYVLGASGRWIQARVISDDGPDLALVGITADVVGILQPRMMGTWFAGFTSEVGQVPRLLLDLVNDIRQIHPEASVGLLASTVEGPEGAVYARLDEEAGRWDVVDRTVDPANERRTWLDEFTLLGRLAQLVH